MVAALLPDLPVMRPLAVVAVDSSRPSVGEVSLVAILTQAGWTIWMSDAVDGG